MMYPNAVLSRSVTAQPVTPASGDRYLIPVAATGTDWAGKDGKVGIYKGSRWFFAAIPVGRLLYVEDETAFYHRNVLGVWTAGVGSIAIGANSLNITNMLGAKASFVVKVENQTTNTPPASPVAPTAYIIGPSPVGAWAGNAGKLAICLINGAFTIITPAIGDEVYDKSTNTTYRYMNSAWKSAAGSWVDRQSVATASGSTTAPSGTSLYVYSSLTAPTTARRRLIDTVTITHTAKKTGSVLRFDYTADALFTLGATTGSSTLPVVIAIFRDSVIDAIAWKKLQTPVHDLHRINSLLSVPITSFSISASIQDFFEVTSPDASSHTYTIAIISGVQGGITVDAGTLERRLFTIQEAA